MELDMELSPFKTLNNFAVQPIRHTKIKHLTAAFNLVKV